MNEISSAMRSKITALKPVNLWRKQGAVTWVGVAVILVVCLVFAWQFAAIDEEKEQAKETIRDVLLKKPAPKKPQFLTSEKLEEVLDAERHRTKNNQLMIDRLEAMVNGYGKDIAALRQAIQNNTTEIDSLRQWINELEDHRTKATALKKEKAARTTRRKKRARMATNRSESVPYELAAIDYWGGVPNAVIRANGRLHTLKQGYSLLGWTVETIDGSRGVVTLRDHQGHQAKITTTPE